MDKKANKENRSKQCKSMKITSIFKVKKCLFDSDSEFKSPQPILDAQDSPVVPTCLFGKQSFSPDMVLGCDDSPFSQFLARKRRVEGSVVKNDWDSSTPNRMNICTPNKMDICTTPLKKNAILIRKLVDEAALLKTTSPEANPIKLAVQKSIQEPDLIGDFSKPCILPIIEGKHPDLKTISPQTVARLLQETNSPKFTIIDCRYPYEYNGGHIKNALNIYFKGDAENEFFSNKENVDSTILLFYCEFSSERAPSM